MTDSSASDFIICPMLCYSNGTDNNRVHIITWQTKKKAWLETVKQAEKDMKKAFDNVYVQPLNVLTQFGLLCLLLFHLHNKNITLESSHSPQVLPPRQCYSPGGVTIFTLPAIPLCAIITKISKWSRIQDCCRITPKIESLVVCAIPNILSKFQKDPSITFWVILLTDRQTNKETKSGKNITSLAEVKMHQNLSLASFGTTGWSLTGSEYLRNAKFQMQCSQLNKRFC